MPSSISSYLEALLYIVLLSLVRSNSVIVICVCRARVVRATYLVHGKLSYREDASLERIYLQTLKRISTRLASFAPAPSKLLCLGFKALETTLGTSFPVFLGMSLET